jgi:hypothetical protein
MRMDPLELLLVLFLVVAVIIGLRYTPRSRRRAGYARRRYRRRRYL